MFRRIRLGSLLSGALFGSVGVTLGYAYMASASNNILNGSLPKVSGSIMSNSAQTVTTTTVLNTDTVNLQQNPQNSLQLVEQIQRDYLIIPSKTIDLSRKLTALTKSHFESGIIANNKSFEYFEVLFKIQGLQKIDKNSTVVKDQNNLNKNININTQKTPKTNNYKELYFIFIPSINSQESTYNLPNTSPNKVMNNGLCATLLDHMMGICTFMACNQSAATCKLDINYNPKGIVGSVEPTNSKVAKNLGIYSTEINHLLVGNVYLGTVRVKRHQGRQIEVQATIQHITSKNQATNNNSYSNSKSYQKREVVNANALFKTVNWSIGKHWGVLMGANGKEGNSEQNKKVSNATGNKI